MYKLVQAQLTLRTADSATSFDGRYAAARTKPFPAYEEREF
ncbi:hypothetical protein ACN4EK_28910 [Pantanalinema rosaneae CENA516]